MLKKENKYIILVLMFLFFSCNYEKKERKQKEIKCRQLSEQAATVFLYKNVFSIAIDSLSSYVDNKLDVYKMQRFSNWQLDSLICFNKEADKFVGCLENQETKYVNNSLQFFYGIKIKEQWCFFTGATIYTFSEMYGQKEKTPLSFEKLHEIAMKEVFNGYLIKDVKGNWQINDKFFDYHFKGSGCGYMKVDKNGMGHWIDTCSDETFNKMIFRGNLIKWYGHVRPPGTQTFVSIPLTTYNKYKAMGAIDVDNEWVSTKIKFPYREVIDVDKVADSLYKRISK